MTYPRSPRRAVPSPVDERTGLIRYVMDLPIGPGEPTIFNASVKMADTARYMPSQCFDNNGGSGLTREAARDAAIGEGVERYCVSSYDPSELVFGTARELGREYPIAEPAGFALFHPDQTVEVPHFTDDVPIAWAWAYSVVRRAPVLVPACLVYMPYSPCFSGKGERVIAPAVSTGLACARSHEEAVLKGLCEVVERDAFMIMWLNRLPMRRVDFTSSQRLGQLYRDRLQGEGLEYVLIETTTDVAIPSYLCLLIDRRGTKPLIAAGGAAALGREPAAAKALLEAVQTREWAKFLRRTRGDLGFAPDYSDIRDFEDHVALYAYGDMMPAVEFLTHGNDLIPLEDGDGQRPREIGADLERAIQAVAALGLRVVALDLTTADIRECGLTVVKVMIPHMQPLYADHWRPFLGGRRLYEVPRRLGYTGSDTTIDALNPDPHPYP